MPRPNGNVTFQAMYERFSRSTNDQKLVNRRIIIADSVAESSFSVENIDVVIDSGLQEHSVGARCLQTRNLTQTIFTVCCSTGLQLPNSDIFFINRTHIAQ